jgi:hypothetical protein
MLARVLAFAVAAAAGGAFAQAVPAGYPADYAQTIAAANKEGKVVIYSALDTKAAQPLVKDFQALYPGIKVEYNDMNSTEMYNRFIAEVASGQGSADVMWSSAMDLQVKLVDDGHALTYASPEAGKLPSWAAYKSQAYGTTYEPAVFIYNKRLVAADEVPQDHAAFAKLITTKADKFKGKVRRRHRKSGVGFMFVMRDQNISGIRTRGFGASNYRVYSVPATCSGVLGRLLPRATTCGFTPSSEEGSGAGVVLQRTTARALARDVHWRRSEERTPPSCGPITSCRSAVEADRQRSRVVAIRVTSTRILAASLAECSD